MTRKQALAELIAQVEAGHWMHGANTATRIIFPYDERSDNDLGLCAFAAFEGSLDAAKALHEAVLPNYGVGIGMPATKEYCAELFDENDDSTFAFAETPARAWLLAILRALYSMEPDT